MSPSPVRGRLLRCPYCEGVYRGSLIFRRHLDDCFPYRFGKR